MCWRNGDELVARITKSGGWIKVRMKRNPTDVEASYDTKNNMKERAEAHFHILACRHNTNVGE